MKRILPVILLALLLPAAVYLLARGGGDSGEAVVAPGAREEPILPSERDLAAPADLRAPAEVVPSAATSPEEERGLAEELLENPVVHGRLVDAIEGIPLADWRIFCPLGKKHRRVAVTDEEGRFSFPPRPEEVSTLELKLGPGNWVRPVGGTLNRAQAEGRARIELRIPAAPIVGRMRARRSDRPVPGLQLQIGRPWGAVETVVGDAEGNFRTQGCYPEGPVFSSAGSGMVESGGPPVHVPGGDPVELVVSIGPIVPLELVAPPEAELEELTGELVRPSRTPERFFDARRAQHGPPQAKADQVSLDPPMLWFVSEHWADAVDFGPDGRAPARLQVRTMDGAWVGECSGRFVPGLQEEPSRVVLHRAGSIEGVVLDAEGRPPARAFVMLAIPGARDDPTRRFRPLPHVGVPRAFRIDASTPFGERAMSPAQERRENLLAPAPALQRFVPPAYLLASPSVRVDAEGRWQLAGLLPREYVLLVFMKGGATHAEDVTVRPGRSTSITVRTPTPPPTADRVFGTLVCEGEARISDPCILLTREAMGNGAESWLLRRSEHLVQRVILQRHEAGWRGEFSFDDLPSATYRLELLSGDPFPWSERERIVASPAGPIELVCHNDVPCDEIRVLARGVDTPEKTPVFWMELWEGGRTSPVRAFDEGGGELSASLPRGTDFTVRIGAAEHEEVLRRRSDFAEIDGVLRAEVTLERTPVPARPSSKASASGRVPLPSRGG